MRKVVANVVVIASMLGVPSVARADDGVRALAHDTPIDLAVTLSLTMAFMASEALKPELVPAHCRWCARDEGGRDTLNPVDRGVRRALVWNDTHVAGAASHVVAFGILPAATFGVNALAAERDSALRGAKADALIAAESTLAAIAVNQIVKLAFARERPFVHYRQGGRSANPADDNLSFYSGHTNLAFALATSSGTVASLRGYALAPAVWATGLSLATLVGYLRIAADKHYFSDVLTGAIVGTLVGVSAPLLFHAREP